MCGSRVSSRISAQARTRTEAKAESFIMVQLSMTSKSGEGVILCSEHLASDDSVFVYQYGGDDLGLGRCSEETTLGHRHCLFPP